MFCSIALGVVQTYSQLSFSVCMFNIEKLRMGMGLGVTLDVEKLGMGMGLGVTLNVEKLGMGMGLGVSLIILILPAGVL